MMPFIMARPYLDRGELPERGDQVEEFVNHFRYNYTPASIRSPSILKGRRPLG
jgi:hypothetical protein